MGTTNPQACLTRRGFLELSSVALANAALCGQAIAAKPSLAPQNTVDSGKAHSTQMIGKIALEDHFGLPESANYAGKDLPTEEARANFFDLGSRRMAEMDRCDLEICIVSLGAPGVQAVSDTSKAIDLSRRKTLFH